MAITVAIANTTAVATPRLPFSAIAEHTLGPAAAGRASEPQDYDLSIAIIGNQRSRTLNRQWRGKDAPTNVLSFPLDDHAGEVFLNPHVIAAQAPAFDMSYNTAFAFFYIHGLLHLKGYTHGSRMEQKEREALRLFKL